MNHESETAKKKLLQIYQKWETELHTYCSELVTPKFSFPYYLDIPDHWFDSENRIMIVGEEGAGEERFACSIEESQRFNKEYMISQLKGGDKNYRVNRSPFWRRFRKLAELPGSAVCWNNLDKIHILRKGKGPLEDTQRQILHRTPIKILQEEIKLLRPTHIVFFGWHGISLQQECPEIFNMLYPNGLKDNSAWKEKKMASFNVDDIRYFFTYHPGWSNRQGENGKIYESNIIRELERTLS